MTSWTGEWSFINALARDLPNKFEHVSVIRLSRCLALRFGVVDVLHKYKIIKLWFLKA